MKRLTPQELIDLPGAGKAEEHLPETGRWRLTPLEHLKRADNVLEQQDRYSLTAWTHIDKAITALEQEEPQS